jgi:ribose-phosphate pyrophosphokinase
MELCIMIDACKRASARQITAVMPYYGYARADRKTSGRESITAKLTANLITEAGVNRILAMDLHSYQIQAYFDIPVDHLYASPVLVSYLEGKNIESPVIVSPDVGGVARARALAKKLNDAPLAIVDKRRLAHNESEVMNVIGDVAGKTAIIVDDIIDTAGTICEAGRALLAHGAKEVYSCATHAVFSGTAVERLANSPFKEVILTNTIPVPPEKRFSQLTTLSVANLLGEAIWRIHEDSSVSSMFR